VNVPGLNEERYPIINTAIRQLAEGSSNALSQVTLTPSATSTVVSDLATTYVSARTKGSFTLTHANAATANRTFSYRISRK
jgi:hypothetical protein